MDRQKVIQTDGQTKGIPITPLPLRGGGLMSYASDKVKYELLSIGK